MAIALAFRWEADACYQRYGRLPTRARLMTTTAEPVRVGVIGCGHIMRSIYAPTLQSVAEICVVGACDLNLVAATETAAQFMGAKPYADARVMLIENRLDAALILTSEKVNAAVARLVLKANLPVYLEKPPAVHSAELEELIDAECSRPNKIYTAFNRRHTPLVSQLPVPGAKLRRVSGALRRRDRDVGTFPYTAIHLIDSAQYFAGSLLQDWKVAFARGSSGASWVIDGRLENGAICHLQFVPDGGDFVEFLRLETDEGEWEMQFPNPAAAVPEGEVILCSREGQSVSIKRGEKAMPAYEAMGFRGSLVAFLRHLKGESNMRHRLASCRSTVALMEEMLGVGAALAGLGKREDGQGDVTGG